MIREVLQGCGAWDLSWSDGVPGSVLNDVPLGPSTLLVFPSTVSVSSLTDTDRVASLFEGPITTIGSNGIAGWEPSWLVQKPDSDGTATVSTKLDSIASDPGTSPGLAWLITTLTDSVLNGVSLDTTNTDIDQAARALFVDDHPNLDLTAGGNDLQFGVRTWLDHLMELLTTAEGTNTYSWAITPGMELVINIRENIYRQHEIIFSDTATQGHSGTAINIPSTITSAKSIDTYASGARYVLADGTIPSTTPVTNPAVTSPSGSDFIIWAIKSGDASTNYVFEILERMMDGKGVREACTVKVLSRNARQHVTPGDLVYTLDPDGIVKDTSGSILHFGQEAHPISQWVTEVAWSPTVEQSVVARVGTDDYVDLSSHVVRSGTGDGLTVTLSDSWLPPTRAAGLADTDRLAASRQPWRQYQPPVNPGTSIPRHAVAVRNPGGNPRYDSAVRIGPAT